ncbi:MAG TPA: DUF255 domain-containing protein [Gemmatimonadales bacterium]|jgi:uncharacterized protein YyaL (SSP411 family)|nr:DUF255 domain-containing protein [Gemmatimonadales bacterium]
MRPHPSYVLMALAAAACATERGALTNQMTQSETRYLARAARQPVSWQPWGREAFTLAARLDRPILLYVGADDCRWCVVMDREAYADKELGAMIDSLFVPVRVDRDERPDVARRYEAEVGAIAGLQGVPLTVVLTPDGAAFFGGTYFTPDDPATGRGLKQILPALARSYHADRTAVVQRAALIRQVASNRRNVRGVLRATAVDSGVEAVRRAVARPGGVTGFVATQAIALLLTEYGSRGDTAALHAGRAALDAMLDSGAVGADGGLDDPPVTVRAGLARDLALAWVLTADPRYQTAGRRETRTLARELLQPIDHTVFTDREAYAIGSLLEAASAVGDTAGQAAARDALDALLRQVYASGYGVRHTLVGSVDGLFQDQLEVAVAALDAYEATGVARYLEVARDLSALMERSYGDPLGGFYDATPESAPIPALADRTVSALDDLLPAANPWAAGFLLRLSDITGDARYRRRAQATLEAVAGAVSGAGPRASGFLTAARQVLTPATAVPTH